MLINVTIIFQMDMVNEEKKEKSKEQDETVYFCTNCFQRYLLTENNEEIVS